MSRFKITGNKKCAADNSYRFNSNNSFLNFPYITCSVAPAVPVAPVGPVAPAVPVAPVGPVGPVVPAVPVAPVGPVGPVAPAVPVAPVGPVGPVGAVTYGICLFVCPRKSAGAFEINL